MSSEKLKKFVMDERKYIKLIDENGISFMNVRNSTRNAKNFKSHKKCEKFNNLWRENLLH